MKKIVRNLLFVVLSLCMVFTVAACGENEKPTEIDFSYLESYELNGITLDMYEELELLPVEGEVEGITLTSADPSVVEVNGYTLISMKEGSTTITASRNGMSKSLVVRVYDTGARLGLGVDQNVAYIDTATDIGFHVVYNGKSYAYGREYRLTVPADYADYAEIRDGKIYGKQEGEIKIEAQIADYKGQRVKGTFTVKICPASFVDVKESEVTLHAAKGSKLSYAQITADVHYQAKKVSDPSLVYEVTAGEDKVSVSADGKITALEEGEATVRVKYGANQDVYADVTVTVKPNYVNSAFIPTPVGGQVYRLYTGEDEIGGRKDGIYEFVQGTGGAWESRMGVEGSDYSIINNARRGYKYFAYDVYFTGFGIYVGMDGADCQFFNVADPNYGNFHRADYVQIVDCETGAITNRLVRNRWVRIVYDLDYYLTNSKYVSFSGTPFFFTTNTSSDVSYIDNVRWYLDDEYYDHDAAGNVKHTLNADGTISATNNEWTLFNDTIRTTNPVEYFTTSTTYAPADGEIGGVSGAWKYSPVTKEHFTDWNNMLILSSSAGYRSSGSGDSGYNASSLINLTEGIAKAVGAPTSDNVEDKYKYLTFDLYVENGSSFAINLNHTLVGGTIKLGTTKSGYVEGGTDLSTKSTWIKAWEKGSDKLAYYVEAGKWYTISLAYFDNYDPNSWAGNIFFTGKNGANYYFNDIKFRKTIDGVAPTEYAGYRPTSGMTMVENTESEGGLFTWGGEGFEGALKYTTSFANVSGKDSWSYSRVTFDNVGFAGGNQSAYFKAGNNFITFDVYMGENMSKMGVYSWATHEVNNVIVDQTKQYSATLTVGGEIPAKAYVYDADGKRVSGTFAANAWYTVVIPAECLDGATWANTSLQFQTTEYGTEGSAYIKNITYSKELPDSLNTVVISDKPNEVKWKELAGANTAESKNYTLSYFATPGYEIEWSVTDADGNATEAATIADGVITFNRGEWNSTVKVTATVDIDGYEVSDSFEVTFSNDVTEFVGGSGSKGSDANLTFAYGEGDEIDVICISTTKQKESSGVDWETGAQFTMVTVGANGRTMGSFFQSAANKYVKVEVSLGSNARFDATSFFMKGSGGVSTWHQKPVIVGSTTQAYLYDSNGVRVVGNVAANTWYTLYIPVDCSQTPDFGRAMLNLRSLDGNSATIKVKNIQAVSAISADVVEPFTISGAPSGDLKLYEEGAAETLQLTANTDLALNWTVSDADIATIDQTGKLTFTKTKKGTITVTATPTAPNYAALAKSVEIAVLISEYDEPIKAWHFESSSAVWQGQAGEGEDTQFEKSWKATGKHLYVANSLKEQSNADYITFDAYFQNTTSFTFVSPMYGGNMIDHIWMNMNNGTTTAGELRNKPTSDWRAEGTSTGKYVRFYDLNGNTPSSLKCDTWYKVVIPKHKVNSIGWSADSYIQLENSTGVVYFRNVSYGNVAPTTYDLKLTGVPTSTNVFVGGEVTLGVTKTHSFDAIPAYTWSSSATNIAEVNANGKITFKAAGSVTITATPTATAQAALAKSVTFSVSDYSISINEPSGGTSITWAGLPTDKSITLTANYPSVMTDVTWSVDEDLSSYATVDSNGKVTFLAAGIDQDIVINVSAKTPSDETKTGSITFSLTNPVRGLKASTNYSLEHGTGDEVDTVLMTSSVTSSTSNSWDYYVGFTDIVYGSNDTVPVADFRSHNYKYVALNVEFDNKLSTFGMTMWLNNDKTATYGRTITMGSATATDIYLYDAQTNVRIVGAVEAGKLYKLFIPVDYSRPNTNWAQARLTAKATEGTTVVKLSNIEYVTAMGTVYDLNIVGTPNRDIVLSEGSLTLNAVADMDYEWSSSNTEVATVVATTGVVTFVTTGEVTIYCKPTNQEAYSALNKSVTLKIIANGAEPSSWHLQQSSEWQTEGNYANSWKASSVKTLTISGLDSSCSEGTRAAARANYITFEINIANVSAANSVNYVSNMYNGYGQTMAWMSASVIANKKVELGMKTYTADDYKTVKNNYGGTGKFMAWYTMDGTLVNTALSSETWYKIVLPCASENVTFGSATLTFDGNTDVYFRNVSYGDSIPAGWVNA